MQFLCFCPFVFLFVEVDDEDVFKDYEVEQFSKYDDYQKKGEEELEQGYATLGHTPSARVSAIYYNAQQPLEIPYDLDTFVMIAEGIIDG